MLQIKRKTLTLPSGATCTIRAFSPMDFLKEGSAIPSTIIDGKFKDKTESEIASLVTQREIDWYANTVRAALLRACGALVDGGRRIKIVDKPHYECLPGEITIEDLEQADADMIYREVVALSNLGKEAAQAAGNFPQEKSQPGPDGSQAG